MSTRFIIQRPTMGWRIQIWISFAVSVLACALGLVYMPHDTVNTAFLVIGLIFSVFASFAVAKMTRDNRDGPSDTPLWINAVWGAFVASIAFMAWGLWDLDVTPWHQAFMVVSWLYLVGSAISAAKLMRDQYEANLVDRDAR